MYIAQAPRTRVRRRVHLPHERIQVDGVGLGEVGGFNIGKMISRAVHITPHSFTLKNIVGSIGSVVANVATGGIASIAASKEFGAHGSGAGFIGGAMLPGIGLLPQKLTGLSSAERSGSNISLAVAGAVAGGVAIAGAMAPAAGALAPTAESAFGVAIPGVSEFGSGVVGAGTVLAPASEVIGAGSVLAPVAEGGTFFSTIGSVASSIGTGIKGVGTFLTNVLPSVGQIFGGKPSAGTESDSGGTFFTSPTGSLMDPYQGLSQRNIQPVGPGYIPLSNMADTTFGPMGSGGVSPYDGMPLVGDNNQLTMPDGRVVEASMLPWVSDQTLYVVLGLSAVGLVWHYYDR